MPGGGGVTRVAEIADLHVFRTVLVVTGKKVRGREPVIQGTPYRITVRSEDKLFGTTPVWRTAPPRESWRRSESHHGPVQKKKNNDKYNLDAKWLRLWESLPDG